MYRNLLRDVTREEAARIWTEHEEWYEQELINHAAIMEEKRLEQIAEVKRLVQETKDKYPKSDYSNPLDEDGNPMF